MKRFLALFMLLLLSAAAIATAGGRPAQTPDSMQVFWQNFKNSVSAGKKQAVAGLTKFPLAMSYGVPKIKNRSEFLRRYREVFNVQSDAVQCFAKAKPEIDAAKPKEFTVACPDAAGNEVVVYHFELTPRGWRFVSLDNINE